jgi:hypothetical protein
MEKQVLIVDEGRDGYVESLRRLAGEMGYSTEEIGRIDNFHIVESRPEPVIDAGWFNPQLFLDGDRPMNAMQRAKVKMYRRQLMQDAKHDQAKIDRNNVKQTRKGLLRLKQFGHSKNEN